MTQRIFAAALATALWLSWQGAALAAEPCRTAKFEGDAFTVCAYDPATQKLRLAWRGKAGPLGSFAALKSYLGASASRIAFAMNAGMFEPDQSPVGLYVEAGRELHPLNRSDGTGNFYLKPNGVFWVDARGAPHVSETEAFARGDAQPRWATQSGPLLVEDGRLNPRLTPNGTSLYVRNGVGVKAGEALFVISDEPVSFGRLARFFHDELGCSDALYFDGSVSSLWAPSLGRRDERTGLGTFVVVLKKRRG